MPSLSSQSQPPPLPTNLGKIGMNEGFSAQSHLHFQESAQKLALNEGFLRPWVFAQNNLNFRESAQKLALKAL
jgi:hypothetical protein